MTDNSVPVTTRLASVSGMLTATVEHDPRDILDAVATQAMAVASGTCAGVVTSVLSDAAIEVVATAGKIPTTSSVFVGPGSASIAANAIVVIDDTAAAPDRWTAFAAVAADHGLAAVRAYPIRVDGGPVGAVVVGAAESWFGSTARDALGVQVLADLAGAALSMSTDRDVRRRLSDAVRADTAATADREFAVGIIAQRHGLGIDAALDVLHGIARRSGRSLVETARRIASGDAVDHDYRHNSASDLH